MPRCIGEPVAAFFSNCLFLMMETRVQRDSHWTIVTCLLRLERCGFEM